MLIKEKKKKNKPSRAFQKTDCAFLFCMKTLETVTPYSCFKVDFYFWAVGKFFPFIWRQVSKTSLSGY